MNSRRSGAFVPASVIWTFVTIVGALFIGAASAYEPKLLFAAVVGMFSLLLSLLSPERMSIAIVITSAVSIQYVFHFQMMGMDLQSLYKLGILFLLIPAMMKQGVHRFMLWPIIALVIMVMITYMGSDLPPSISKSAPIKAFIGLAAPFVFLLIRWDSKTSGRHIQVVTLLPLCSVVIGVLLQAAGLHAATVTEFTGAFRLQGANIPAHLAFLGFIAFLVSFVELKRNPQKMTFHYTMLAINFLILLLTGTRGPLVAAAPMMLLYVFDLIKQYTKGKIVLIIPLFGFVTVLSAAIYLQLDNFMKRSFGRQTDTVIDTSGRAEAWAFFLDGVKDSSWMGRGLGSVLVANDGSIYSGFVVPHNEYIRFYYDTGWIGASCLFLALGITFSLLYKRLPTGSGVTGCFAMFIAGFMIYSFTDNTLSTVQFIVPFCVYLCALINHPGSGSGDRRESLYGEGRTVQYPLRQF
jgi:teichuronic acid biosynthesis protein TuaE